jgi:hypothetical protein
MGSGWRDRLPSLAKPATIATDLDLISFLQAIPDAHMRRGRAVPGLVPAAGGDSGDLERMP